MLETLFPDEVVFCKAEGWMWETPTLPEEEAFVEKAVSKRQREFRAGRHSSHQALHELLDTPLHSNGPIIVGDSRQPCWPEGVVGSISHSGDHCSAVVAHSRDMLSIGHDVEKNKAIAQNTYSIICTRNELNFININASAGIPLATIIFSAKESIHKTYSPINKHMLDFLDAEIELDITNKTFKAKILKPEPNPRYNIRVLNGKFAVDDGYIYTAICLRASDVF
ncbi:MAG: hypothetical protein COA99_01990 [Moraxellaceae bacterium]|nr:MAG: hypothetical protein COA99_01990 [Moraxellaceae bacterium]